MKWPILKISDFAEVITGGTPSTNIKEYWENGTIPWLNSGELNQEIIRSSGNYITEQGLLNSAAKVMPINTVLIALTGATTGKTGLLTFEACANQSVTGILPSKIHFPKYLYYYLTFIRKKVISDAYGGAQKHISQAYVKNLQIPLPPLPVQRRISEILDTADALRRMDLELLAKYDELAQSIFIDMFGDPVRNEKGWEIGTIRDLSNEVKYGTSSPSSENGKYPYLRMNNITYSGEWDFSNLKYINLTESEFNKYSIQKRDLIFNRTNSKELVGKTAVFNLDDKMVIAGYLIRVRTNPKGNPYFISGFLNSIFGKAILQGMCKNIIGMANINAQELQSISIPIPPIKYQNEYESNFLCIKEMKELAMNSYKKSNLVFNSILQKSFSGELVA